MIYTPPPIDSRKTGRHLSDTTHEDCSVTPKSGLVIGRKKHRNSNLELYRIIVMLLIVAHHYVVNSGLIDAIKEAPFNAVSATMLMFGAWGKTGINCFVLITGYFMCKSSFSLHKLLKLYLQIVFYAVVIYGIFCLTRHEEFSAFKSAFTLFPVKSIAQGFTSCFILFYLFIPFLNIFLNILDKRMHGLLVILMATIYTLLPSVGFQLSFNYVSWFIVLYFIASYIRFYGIGFRLSHRAYGIVSIILILVGSASVLGMFAIYKYGYIGRFAPYFFISDSNKLISLAIAVTTFMWFKDLKISHSRLINAIGATTFGVLLIHANSDAMRQWLWRETVDCIGHFGDSLLWTLGYASLSVMLIFIVCSGIDWFRGKLIEPRLMKAFDKLFREIPRRELI